MKKEFKCEILDKEKKSGFFWDTYKITLRLIETGTVITLKATLQQYYDLPVGGQGFITLYQHADNLWYTCPE